MEWQLASPDVSCFSCRRPFAEREEYWSAIFPRDEGFSRRDCCADCWQGPQEGMFSYWRTRCRPKPLPPKRFVNDGVLLEFFDRLAAADPARAKVSFIMAVLLLRKRLLKETSRRRDEAGVVWRVYCPALEKSYEVRDAGFSEGEIAEVLQEIGRVLNIELGEPVAADERTGPS